MKNKIPSTMRALLLENYNLNLVKAIRSLKLVEKPVPKPSKSQVLIEVDATTCNPSDLSFMQGVYGIKKEVPIVPGFEGTGIVVDAENEHGKNLIGKRVSFNADSKLDGSWAEYAVTNVNLCIPVNPAIAKEQAACMLVNPYSAFALFEIAQKNKSKAIVQNAAGSQLAGMIQEFAKQAGIIVINIVRKDTTVEMLKNRGEKYVLNSESENFEDELSKLAHTLQASLAFDAVSGDLSGKILNAMPAKSELIIYGALTGQNANNIGARDLIFFQKKISGFILTEWFLQNNQQKILEATIQLQTQIAKGEIYTRIVNQVSFEDTRQALIRYITNMSAGKVIILPKK